MYERQVGPYTDVAWVGVARAEVARPAVTMRIVENFMLIFCW